MKTQPTPGDQDGQDSCEQGMWNKRGTHWLHLSLDKTLRVERKTNA